MSHDATGGIFWRCRAPSVPLARFRDKLLHRMVFTEYNKVGWQGAGNLTANAAPAPPNPAYFGCKAGRKLPIVMVHELRGIELLASHSDGGAKHFSVSQGQSSRLVQKHA